MAFELSNMFISSSASSTMTVLKEKHFSVNTEVIVIMVRCFLYLKITFEVGWYMSFDKGSKFSNFGILRILERNLSVSLQLPLSFAARVLSSARFFFKKILTYLAKKAEQFSKNICFLLGAFHSTCKIIFFRFS